MDTYRWLVEQERDLLYLVEEAYGSNEMSLYSNVNGRGHRTRDDKAKCAQCKHVYIKWDFIGKDGKCYQCHGVDGQDQVALIQFIQANK